MTQIKRAWNLSLKYRPFNITKKQNLCMILCSKNFKEQEAFEFIGVKRSRLEN